MQATSTSFVNLKGAFPKAYWGCSQTQGNGRSVVVYKDNEIIYAVGCRLALYDVREQTSTLVQLHHNDIRRILSYEISTDQKYIALAVKIGSVEDEKTARLVIYDVDSLAKAPIRPTIITHTHESSPVDDLHFTAYAFSDCSQIFAAALNDASCGTIVYNRLMGNVMHKIPTVTLVSQVTFNPSDPTRLCTTGDENLFQFWRYTQKSVHSIPVSGLKKSMEDYTCHAQMQGGRVVAGTKNGFLALAHGTNIQPHTPKDYAFGAPNTEGRLDSKVVSVLVRNDMIFAASEMNYLSMYEARRVSAAGASTNTHSATYSLVCIVRLCISNFHNITGIHWCISSTSNYEAVVCSPHAIGTIDLKAGDYRLAHSESNASNTNATLQSDLHFTNQKIDHVCLTFHREQVKALSVASRISSFVTCSEDDTVRSWDFAKSNNSRELVFDDFSMRKREMPNHIEFHPSGQYVAFACEDDVREYALTDARFEMVRKLSTKASFEGPNGVPFANAQPVSLVRYSYGGHLLAAVTGRLAQVFHMYNLTFSSEQPNGNPSRIMALTDHKAPITDLVFSHCDRFMYTSSMDGYVYSWSTFASHRDGDFYEKNVPLLKLAVGPGASMREKPNFIVGSYSNAPEIIKGLESASVVGKNYASILSKSSKAKSPSASMNASQKPGSRSSRRDHRDRDNDKMSIGEQGFGDAHSAGTPDSLSSSVAGENNHKFYFKDELPSKSVFSQHSPRFQTEEALASREQDKARDLVPQIEKTRNFLAVWKGSITDEPQYVYIDAPATAIAFGKLDGHGGTRNDMLIIGFADGRVLLTVVPIPLKAIVVNLETPMSMSRRGKRPFMAGSSPDRIGTSDSRFGDSSSRYDTNNASPETSRRPSGKYAHGSTSQSSGRSTRNGSRTSRRVLMNEDGDGKRHVNDAPASANRELDTKVCPSFQLHSSQVTSVAICGSGLWAFSAGADGSVFMLGTSFRARDMIEVPELNNIENTLVTTEKNQLIALQGRMEEIDSVVNDTKRDCERNIKAITDKKNQIINGLESQMKREVQKRDEIILRGRDDLVRQTRKLQEDMRTVEKKLNDDIVEMESMYERKLTQESLYLAKMRQAFDEIIVHARMDMEKKQVEAEERENELVKAKHHAVDEAEKEKAVVLMYVDYVKTRYNEVMRGLEDGQDRERNKMKLALTGARETVDETQVAAREQVAALNRQINDLNETVAKREDETMKVRSDLDWANTRIGKLETALKQATDEVKRYVSISGKWEKASGEYQEHIRDLERVRKSLTSQLHMLRKDMGPKEERLTQTTDKLEEVGREYEKAVHVIADKDNNLTRKIETTHLLQKQLGDLRTQCSQKDAALRRAAALFEEYKMSLQNSIFNAARNYGESAYLGGAVSGGLTAAIVTNGGPMPTIHERPVKKSESRIVNPIGSKANLVQSVPGPGGKVEEEVQNALKRLHELLSPYINAIQAEKVGDDAQLAFEERERQVELLHKNINILRNNLEHSQEVSATVVKKHLNDNSMLLGETNKLRHEVRKLSMENQRLAAKFDYEKYLRVTAEKSLTDSIERDKSRGLVGDRHLNTEMGDRILGGLADTSRESSSGAGTASPLFSEAASPIIASYAASLVDPNMKETPYTPSMAMSRGASRKDVGFSRTGSNRGDSAGASLSMSQSLDYVGSVDRHFMQGSEAAPITDRMPTTKPSTAGSSSEEVGSVAGGINISITSKTNPDITRSESSSVGAAGGGPGGAGSTRNSRFDLQSSQSSTKNASKTATDKIAQIFALNEQEIHKNLLEQGPEEILHAYTKLEPSFRPTQGRNQSKLKNGRKSGTGLSASYPSSGAGGSVGGGGSKDAPPTLGNGTIQLPNIGMKSFKGAADNYMDFYS